MPITTLIRSSETYAGTGASMGPFGFAYKVFQPSDVDVVVTGTDGLETTMPVGDYVVTLNADQDATPGGSVMLDAALASGLLLVIVSDIPATQEINWLNQGRYRPDLLNKSFDKVTALIQQLDGDLDRLEDEVDDINLGPITILAQRKEIIATAGQTVFHTDQPYTVGYLGVYLNGARLSETEFTATDGLTITIHQPCHAGDVVLLEGFLGSNIAVEGPPGPAGPSGTQVMFIGDNPPPAPVVGQTWWESDTGNTFVYYDDGTSAQWVPAHVGTAASVNFVQAGAGAVIRTSQDKMRESITVLDYVPGIDDVAKRAYVVAGNNMSPAIAAALAEAGARGGAEVFIPPVGKPWVMNAGVTVPEGVRVRGLGRTYHGPPYFTPAGLSDRGTWIQPKDTINPCFTMGYGCNIEGLNFVWDQPAPVTSVAYVPTTFPYAIRATQSMFGIEDCWFIAGTHGIEIVYNGANGGGTYGWLNNIWMDTFKVGIRWKNVNDTMHLNNYHFRNLWWYNSPEVVAYRFANAIGLDVEYLDNLMGTNIELFQCLTGIRLTNSTVDNGFATTTQACGYLQLSNLQFNLVNQAIAVASTATVGQMMLSQVLIQSDLVDNHAAQYQLDFNTTGLMEIFINGLWCSFAGHSLAKFGSGCRVNIGGAFQALYSGDGASPCFNIDAGAIVILPSLTAVQPNSGTAGLVAGTGTLTDPRFSNAFVGLPGLGDVALHGGTATRCGYIEFRQLGGVRQGYLGFSTAGLIELVADTGNKFQFAQAPRLIGLPTSAAGLISGDIWRDAAAGNVIKIVP